MAENRTVRPREEILLENPNVASQEAIVNLSLSPKNIASTIHRTIPGGLKLFEVPMTNKILADKIFTWLKHVRYFSSVTIGFTNDPGKYKTATEQLADLPVGNFNIWDLSPPVGGKRYLADRLADLILKNKALSFTVTKDKIVALKEVPKKEGKTEKYEFTPASEDFMPYIEFVTIRN